MVEDFLLQVKKPARYIGGEWNLPKKDFSRAQIKFALCFPDLYEVGMSNLGIRIIYGILNALDDTACERFFSVDLDMEELLRKNSLEIFSLETKRPLKEFDLIGFSLGHELCYTNVLNILDLGKIPLEASLRSRDYPLVIGGGPCTMNPEPMHEFFDLFVLGEAEDVILEIVELYRKHKDDFKSGKISKEDLLAKFAFISGVYVPSLYEIDYYPSGEIKEFRSKKSGLGLSIKKRFVGDLDQAYFPREWIIPYIQIIHDRLTLEITRGCPNRCRFCQARSQYYPFRQRHWEKVVDLAKCAYRNTGYEEISLCGLSVSDYPQIENLLKTLITFFKEKAVSLSLPSIKPKTIVGGLLALISTIKKTGLTFAPEAGRDKLRQALAKDFNEKEFLEALEVAYKFGYQHIKLYFMIGLPLEEEVDLDAILDFASNVSELRRKVARGAASVNVSINTFIPKPHTPLQWFKAADPEEIKSKQNYLRKKSTNRRIKLNFHNVNMSVLEAVLSRADRRLSKVIFSAFRKGARFDAWSNYFVFEKWLEAFGESNIDLNFYLKEKSKDSILPWDFLDVGVSKESLIKEFEDVQKTIATE